MSELIKEWVELSVDGGKMRAYTARPANITKAPSVLVFQEIFGVNPHIRDVTERVAGEGYFAISPDYYWRTDPGVELDYNQEGMTRGFGNAQKTHSEQLVHDIEASINHINSLPYTTDKIGAMGFCFGGHVAYLAACETNIAAAASFYGGGIATFRPGGGAPTVSLTPNIRAEMLCLFGAKDHYITPENVDTIRRALMESRINYEVSVYPDADHGFFCDRRGSFHEASRDDAWRKVQRLFARTLKG